MQAPYIVGEVTNVHHVKVPARIYAEFAELAQVPELNRESFASHAERAISRYLIMKFIDADKRVAASKELVAMHANFRRRHRVNVAIPQTRQH